MRRHWSTRVLNAVIAIWFVLSVGEPSVAHFCPTHGSAGGAHGAMAHSGHTHGGHDHGHSAQHHCSCINCCVGAGGSALRPGDVAIVTARTIDVRIISRTADALPRPAPYFPQPLATGPPRV